MTTATTTEPKPPLTPDEKRAATGVVIVALNLHRYLHSPKRFDKARVLGDVAYIQDALANWTDDGTRFGMATKQLVLEAIAEVVMDKRMKAQKTDRNE